MALEPMRILGAFGVEPLEPDRPLDPRARHGLQQPFDMEVQIVLGAVQAEKQAPQSWPFRGQARLPRGPLRGARGLPKLRPHPRHESLERLGGAIVVLFL